MSATDCRIRCTTWPHSSGDASRRGPTLGAPTYLIGGQGRTTSTSPVGNRRSRNPIPLPGPTPVASDRTWHERTPPPVDGAAVVA